MLGTPTYQAFSVTPQSALFLVPCFPWVRSAPLLLLFALRLPELAEPLGDGGDADLLAGLRRRLYVGARLGTVLPAEYEVGGRPTRHAEVCREPAEKLPARYRALSLKLLNKRGFVQGFISLALKWRLQTCLICSAPASAAPGTRYKLRISSMTGYS